MKRGNKRNKERIQGTNKEMGERKKNVEGDWRNGKKIEKLKKKVSKKEIEKNKKRGGSGGVENILKEVERILEKKEKREKRRNIVIREIKVREKARRRTIEEIMKAVGAKVETKEMRRIGEE